MSETLSIAIVIGLMLGFFKVFDYFSSKKMDSGLSKLLERMTESVEEAKEGVDVLVKQHAQTDTDGMPIWYMPRRWAETQAQVLDILRQISNTQDKLADMTKNIEKKVEGCDYARKVRAIDA